MLPKHSHIYCLSYQVVIYLISELLRLSRPKKENSQSRQRKFAINAISINLFFFLTNLPQAIFSLYLNYTSDVDPQLDFYLTKSLLILYYVNFGSSFYINFSVNSIFREEFFAMINCRSLSNNDRLSIYRPCKR